jgi:hypothetical protein
MNVAGKAYKNNASGVVVKVIDAFENIAILENKQKIDIRELTNTDLYTEELDVSNFFNQNSYNNLVDKIRNIPTDNIPNDGNDGNEVTRVNLGDGYDWHDAVSNESLIINTSEDYEREELAKKYGIVDNSESVNKQNAAFDKLLNPDSQKEEPSTAQNLLKPVNEKEDVQRIDVNREIPQQMPIQEDPVVKMFRGIKRVVDFNITIDLANKIPRIDFIEMMEDSYETSIIDFLADEITDSIISNPDNIRNIIKNKIKKTVSDYTKSSDTKTVKLETNSDTKTKRPYTRIKKDKKEEI